MKDGVQIAKELTTEPGDLNQGTSYGRVAIVSAREEGWARDEAFTSNLPAQWKHARRVTLKGTTAVDIVTITPPTLPDASATVTSGKTA